MKAIAFGKEFCNVENKAPGELQWIQRYDTVNDTFVIYFEIYKQQTNQKKKTGCLLLLKQYIRTCCDGDEAVICLKYEQ